MKDETLQKFFHPMYLDVRMGRVDFIWEQAKGGYPHSLYNLSYFADERVFELNVDTREFGQDWPSTWDDRETRRKSRPDLIDEFKARLTEEQIAMCARFSLTGE